MPLCLRRTLKPGNGLLCDTLPPRLVKVTGAHSAYLGNCTTPPRPHLLLPPARA